MSKTASPGDRTGLLEFFNPFVATGITLGGLKAIFDLSKLWLEQRQNCEVTLAFPDGAQLKVSKLYYDEALVLGKKHSQQVGKKRHS